MHIMNQEQYMLSGLAAQAAAMSQCRTINRLDPCVQEICCGSGIGRQNL